MSQSITRTIPVALTDAAVIVEYAIIAYGHNGQFEDWHTDRDGQVLIFPTKEAALEALPEARERLMDPDDATQEIVVVMRKLADVGGWDQPGRW